MPPLWCVVLAAGRGSRLADVTGGVPKQFWAPVGDRCLLEDTIGRLAPLTDPLHTLTVVDERHRTYVEPVKNRSSLGEVIYQPDDRGTATGVLLATMVVSTCDPGAVMVVTPSDHGVRDHDEFRRGIGRAADYVSRHTNDIVLLGVEPRSAAGDYGWIVATPESSDGTCGVASFVEKPSAAAAERLFASGAVWNTMVLVARAESLLGLYRRHAPDLVAMFEGLRFLSPEGREQRVRQMYEHLPNVDLSHDLLTHATGLHCLAWRSSIGWTDLGTPERLAAWLEGGAPVAGRLHPSGQPSIH